MRGEVVASVVVRQVTAESSKSACEGYRESDGHASSYSTVGAISRRWRLKASSIAPRQQGTTHQRLDETSNRSGVTTTPKTLGVSRTMRSGNSWTLCAAARTSCVDSSSFIDDLMASTHRGHAVAIATTRPASPRSTGSSRRYVATGWLELGGVSLCGLGEGKFEVCSFVGEAADCVAQAFVAGRGGGDLHDATIGAVIALD